MKQLQAAPCPAGGKGARASKEQRRVRAESSLGQWRSGGGGARPPGWHGLAGRTRLRQWPLAIARSPKVKAPARAGSSSRLLTSHPAEAALFPSTAVPLPSAPAGCSSGDPQPGPGPTWGGQPEGASGNGPSVLGGKGVRRAHYEKAGVETRNTRETVTCQFERPRGKMPDVKFTGDSDNQKGSAQPQTDRQSQPNCGL